ncbi:Uncharacterised protein [Vibrio cholerae]|nr:Uncharacterised protein [Vibrio cholerae]
MAGNLRSVPATLAAAGLLLLGIGTAAPSECRQRFGHGLIVGSVTRFHLRYSRHDDVDHHLSGRDEFLGTAQHGSMAASDCDWFAVDGIGSADFLW